MSPTVIQSCSFCAKPSTAVRRLVAGPGVYICDQCVALSATVIAEADSATERAAADRARYRDLPAAEILRLLPAVAGNAARVEADLAGWIHRLREHGVGWPTIAETLGVEEDAARRRFDTDR